MDRLVGKYPLPIHASWVRRYALVEHLMGGKIAVISIVASGRSESISLSRAIAARPNAVPEEQRKQMVEAYGTRQGVELLIEHVLTAVPNG